MGAPRTGRIGQLPQRDGVVHPDPDLPGEYPVEVDHARMNTKMRKQIYNKLAIIHPQAQAVCLANLPVPHGSGTGGGGAGVPPAGTHQVMRAPPSSSVSQRGFVGPCDNLASCCYQYSGDARDTQGIGSKNASCSGGRQSWHGQRARGMWCAKR